MKTDPAPTPPEASTAPDKDGKGVVSAATGSAFTGYIPEVWSVKKDAIYAAIHAIESGLEYARQCLCDHHAALGRTTHKNRTWAETIEGDIQQMENARDLLLVRQPNDQTLPTEGAA
jgi:hypothetical protein